MTEAVELRGYSPAAVERAADHLRESVERGQDPALRLPDAFLFRGGDQRYWAYGPRGRRWYERSERGWSQGEPDSDLEGDARLAIWLPAREATGAQPVGSDKGRADPITGVEILLSRLREAYYAARLTHREVEGLLEELVVVDQDGEIWAPGFRDGRWHLWLDGRWTPRPGRPRPAPLPQAPAGTPCSQCGEELRQGLRFCTACGTPTAGSREPDESLIRTYKRIQAGPGLVAQRLAGSWAPPHAFPELLRCPECRALHLGRAEACGVCAGAVPIRANEDRRPNCHNCGGAMRPGIRFCTECGAEVAAP